MRQNEGAAGVRSRAAPPAAGPGSGSPVRIAGAHRNDRRVLNSSSMRRGLSRTTAQGHWAWQPDCRRAFCWSSKDCLDPGCPIPSGSRWFRTLATPSAFWSWSSGGGSSSPGTPSRSCCRCSSARPGRRRNRCCGSGAGSGRVVHAIVGSTKLSYAAFAGIVSCSEFAFGFLVPALFGNVSGGVTLVAVLS